MFLNTAKYIYVSYFRKNTLYTPRKDDTNVTYGIMQKSEMSTLNNLMHKKHNSDYLYTHVSDCILFDL